MSLDPGSIFLTASDVNVVHIPKACNQLILLVKTYGLDVVISHAKDQMGYSMNTINHILSICKLR